MHYLTEHQYKVLCKRAETYAADGYPGCDPRILQTVKVFNRMEGMVVIWSCSGHTFEELGIDKPDLGYTEKRQLVIGITPSGLPRLERISNIMMEQPVEEYHQHWLELGAGLLNWGFELDNDDTEIPNNYKYWEITMQFRPGLDGHHESMIAAWDVMLKKLIM